MPLVGDYDASTFDAGDTATWPPLPAGVALYQPTMHWRVTVAGTVQGQAVVPGDLLFATQGSGRLFGDGNFGDQIFGGISAGGWTVDQVLFLRWDSTQPAPDRDPYPNAGCLFTRADGEGGDWAPGWRIVIDAFYANATGSRTYGTDDFGDDVFGDVDNAGGEQWVDITSPGYRIETGDGTIDGRQRVPVAEVVVELFDDDGTWFDLAEPATWYQPQPGTPLRVGLIDPSFVYHPVVVGEIERIEDVHDDEHPRGVAVRGFGRVMDLTVDMPWWQRPAELASTRFMTLVAMAGWWWDDGAVVFPTPDASLVADDSPRDIVIRDEIDRTVQAAGWMFDTDRRGRMRLRPWPHAPTGDPLVVADCWDETDPGEVATVRVAHAIAYANDESLIINYGMTTNTAGAEAVVEDALSVSRFGRRGRALDYPKTGLPWSSAVAAAVWLRRVVNRFAFTTRHVESLEVDTLVDPGWLAVLADLDSGRAVTVERRSISPFTLDGVVVGWRYVIEPGRWTATLFTSTTTTSM